MICFTASWAAFTVVSPTRALVPVRGWGQPILITSPPAAAAVVSAAAALSFPASGAWVACVSAGAAEPDAP